MEIDNLNEGEQISKLVRLLCKKQRYKEASEIPIRFSGLCDEAERRYPLFQRFESTGEVIPLSAMTLKSQEEYFKVYLPLARKKYIEFMANGVIEIKKEYAKFLD